MVEVQLFGHFEIRSEPKPIEIKSQGLKELLCYLLINRDRQKSREVVATDLWGDRSTSQSLKTLRQSLWQLNKLFEEKLSGFKLKDSEYLNLELNSAVVLDTLQLENSCDFLQSPETLNPQKEKALHNAALAYKGDLLEDWNHDWCLIERERFRSLYLLILDALITHSLKTKEIQKILFYAHLALRLEPARESNHQQLMQAYLQQGDRTSTLQQFGRCKKILKEEFDVEPSQKTYEIYHEALGPKPVESKQIIATNDLQVTLQQMMKILQEIKATLKI